MGAVMITGATGLIGSNVCQQLTERGQQVRAPVRPGSETEIRIDPDDEQAVARYGETLVALAQRTFPLPWSDNSYTRSQLGYTPVPLREAMDVTVAWLRECGQL
jgi:NAD(P)-dependent dehydrogenase (short-subunit alcohol dehydrogenase family)